MTQKDFILIAAIFRSANAASNEKTCDLIYHFADKLENEFPKFNRALFISAASLPPEIE
jgi:hypothetical protein